MFDTVPSPLTPFKTADVVAPVPAVATEWGCESALPFLQDPPRLAEPVRAGFRPSA